MAKKKTVRGPIERIDTDIEKGLNAEQVRVRTENGYGNQSGSDSTKSTAQIIAGNLFTFFNLVLLTIASMFLFFMIYFNAIGREDIVNQYFGFSKFVFLVPAIMNIGIGSAQEIHSLKVIKSLKIVTTTKSKVVRDGKTELIDAEQIVIDDIVLLSPGEQATADMVVKEGEVSVDESMLTGEADHVKKRPGDLVYSGSSVIVGDARCIVTETGSETYAAQLTGKVKSGARHKSELMSSIMKIVKVLTVALGVVFATIVATLVLKIIKTGGDPSIWNGLTLTIDDPVSWGLIALTGGSFGIGMIPSGLVLTTSVALMVSIASLTRKKTLIQELYSLENLSRIDIICLDKTGTLTDGTMNVCDVKPFIPMEDVERYAKDLMSAAGERNATAEAIFQRFGISDTKNYQEKIPFSSATKYSGLVYPDGKKLLMGAPEYLLPEGDERLSYAAECAKEGKRVIALTLDGSLLAFIVIEDQIRPTAPDTLKFFRENGVTVKVISGDNPLTVSKIAQNCGIKNADRYISLAGVPLEDIPDLAEDYTVFARVSPEQKEALVSALQEKGHKVAMTGDGVNDILALRKADSSITFAKATEAAKSCSDVVLLDNDFSHLKDVVGEGRRVIGNIQKTSVLYLMKSVAVCIFAFALIPFGKGQMWFSVENMYMLEAAVIGTGGFLLSLEPRRNPIKGSFMKNISLQSIAAGFLAAVAISLPVLLNTIPKYLNADPFIADQNVRAMMTVLLTIAGLVVVFSKCIPFNKYRGFALLALTFVATVLGFLLPSAYIGGQTIGEGSLAFDKAAGETILNSRLASEMFRPWNSDAVRNLFSDQNNFFVLRLFLYVAIPVFILVMFAVENYARKEYGKDVYLHRAFRIGRRLMLVSGFVLLLKAILTFVELIAQKRYVLPFQGGEGINGPLSMAASIVYLVLLLAVGYFGYKLWKDPTKRNIKITAGMSGLLILLTVTEMLVNKHVVAGGDVLAAADSFIILVMTLFYLTGAVIVMCNYRLGLLKPRDK